MPMIHVMHYILNSLAVPLFYLPNCFALRERSNDKLVILRKLFRTITVKYLIILFLH